MPFLEQSHHQPGQVLLVDELPRRIVPRTVHRYWHEQHIETRGGGLRPHHRYDAHDGHTLLRVCLCVLLKHQINLGLVLTIGKGGNGPEWLVFSDQRWIVAVRTINSVAALIEKGFYRCCLASLQKALGTAYVDAVGINVGCRWNNESQVQCCVHLVLGEDVNHRFAHITGIELELAGGVTGWSDVYANNSFHLFFLIQHFEYLATQIARDPRYCDAFHVCLP